MEATPGAGADAPGEDPVPPQRAEADEPGAPESPEVGAGPVVLVCDHAGAGWAERVARLRERGLRVEVSRSLRETFQRLADDLPPDVLLVDPLSGGGTVELTALEARRHDPLEAGVPVPVLVIVPVEGEDAMLRVDRLLVGGHWDMIRREAGLRELELRLRRLVQQANAAREMVELRHRAFHDDRTDLLRPMAFQARLREHFSAAQRHAHDLAFVLLDLDRFGQINKRHDHTVGDTIIARVGEVIRGTLRAEDVAGRLGGDEFAVLLPYTRKIDAAHVVNRLREEIKKLSGRLGGASGPVDVSASIGFETFDGGDVPSLEVLRNHAERALRVSKLEGGDRATYYRSLGEPPEAGADGDADE